MARSVEELRQESELGRARVDVENEWVGELSDGVKADLNARAAAVSESVREASDTLKAEIGDMGAESLERLQETGRNAMDAARRTTAT